MKLAACCFAALVLSVAAFVFAEPVTRPSTRPASSATKTSLATRGDKMLDAYFRDQTARVADACLADIHTLDDWTNRRGAYRQQLAEMLGLWPEPPRSGLKPVITGTLDHGDFKVEKIQFQSRPGLYVTANLYLPAAAKGPSPAILYVCGHSLVKKDGVSYGNKTGYQHHGEWFARNGYVCLIPDTVQLGEIEGLHHGLYRENMWWWLSRGYTPAGVEAWTGIRCLDYLQSRPEVDGSRIGMTGRSGGGAYTWYTAALDERVKVVVPVAGITDMQNHVVDGCIEGHCDCMYMTNTYRWDFAQVAALIAPRPMLISNSDKDTIFPLDGVSRLHRKVRDIYKLYKADDKLGLLITEGPHLDTQDLRVPAFRWFNRFLKNDKSELKDATAEKLYEPELLRVFSPKQEPADQKNKLIQETFLPAAAPPEVPVSQQAWEAIRSKWLEELKAKTFGGWPASNVDMGLKSRFIKAENGPLIFQSFDFTSQDEVQLSFLLRFSDSKNPVKSIRLHVADQAEWDELCLWLSSHPLKTMGEWGPKTQILGELSNRDPASWPATDQSKFTGFNPADGEALVWFPPRGIGPTAWTGDEKRQRHLLRRFALLGQTLEGMQAWDVRRAIQAVRSLDGMKDLPVTIAARNRMAGVALYASLFEPNIQRLDLESLPPSHRLGPDLLNVQKLLDLPAAVALAADRSEVRLTNANPEDWRYPEQVARKLSWPKERVSIVPPPR